MAVRYTQIRFMAYLIQIDNPNDKDLICLNIYHFVFRKKRHFTEIGLYHMWQLATCLVYIFATTLLMPYSHETFWHTILRLKDKKICDKKIIFRDRFLLTNQGKLFKKNIPEFVFCLCILIYFCQELSLAFKHPWLKDIVLSLRVSVTKWQIGEGGLK